MSDTPSRRARCARCQRPQSHCLCPHVPVVEHRTRVIVLQHPDEARHPMNTARLAVLGLRHAELWVGEQFPALEGVLAQAGPACLLFPAAENGVLVETEPAPRDTPSMLLVPDGTWRQARQLIRANPVLHALPRLSLPAGAPSEYRIRRASEPAAVSTIEALVRALECLEPQGEFRPLLRPFRVMVEQQIEAMGVEVYRRNHLRWCASFGEPPFSM